MNAQDILVVSSVLNWILLFGVAVSVLRLQDLILKDRGARNKSRTPRPSGPEVGSIPPALAGEVLYPLPRAPEAVVGPRSKLVWFMGTDCEACRRRRGLVGMIGREFRETVACVVSCAGRRKEVEEFAGVWESGVSVIIDPGGVNAKRWSVRSVPTVVLVNDDGSVRWSGQASAEDLRAIIEEVSGDALPQRVADLVS